MEEAHPSKLAHAVLTVPWAILRFVWRLGRRVLISLGVLVVLSFLGYFGFEYIVEMIDSRYSQEIDEYLGIDKTSISRLHDPAYFAEQSVMVSEDQKTVACISSPERRILINDPARDSAALHQRDSRLRRQELLHP